jgi:hypothetical protein
LFQKDKTLRKDNTIDAFFALLRSGLWENNVLLSLFGEIDYNHVFLLSQEQAVVGLVAAGLEYVKDIKPPQELVLQYVGQTIQIEQRNKAMNSFIEDVMERMREKGIYALLIKGQGIAQCYERPLWRSSGDIDFFLSNENYVKAKQYLLSFSSGKKPERHYSKEMGINIAPWYVEVHGTLRTGLSTRVDSVIDSVQKEVFYGGDVRSWINGNTKVFLPAPDSDVFLVFTHFIKHFYKEGGVSIRQLCDWCRLLWSYKEKINLELLERRLKRAGLLGEWKGFAAVAVKYLGMQCDAMPLYDDNDKWAKKGNKIVTFILKRGAWRKFIDTIIVGRIFPLNTIRFLPGILLGINWLKFKELLFKRNVQ